MLYWPAGAILPVVETELHHNTCIQDVEAMYQNEVERPHLTEIISRTYILYINNLRDIFNVVAVQGLEIYHSEMVNNLPASIRLRSMYNSFV